MPPCHCLLCEQGCGNNSIARWCMAALECFVPHTQLRMLPLQWHLKEHWSSKADQPKAPVLSSQECQIKCPVIGNSRQHGDRSPSIISFISSSVYRCVTNWLEGGGGTSPRAARCGWVIRERNQPLLQYTGDESNPSSVVSLSRLFVGTNSNLKH